MAPLPHAAALVGALPTDVAAVAVRDGRRWVVAAEPVEVVTAGGADALLELDRLTPGWWAGFLTYDLGRAVERVVPATHGDLGVPDLAFARFDARVELDPGSGEARIVGRGSGRALLARALDDAPFTRPPPRPDLGPWQSSLTQHDFEAGVRAVVELIRAGECYQVNLTRRLTCDAPADPVSLFAELVRHNPSPHGALVRFDGMAVVSASPERFLRRDGVSVETRPIKGTGVDPAALAASGKDVAENVMIVDLARNDLGRVCEFGTVTVPALCAAEAHPGLHHLVSTVRGRLRAGTSTADLVRATFPPASVTGAPKPRVMQAIEDLEPVRRGVYCGAVGWIDTERASLDLNVAIRTFTVAAGCTTLGTGGGIVADSDPGREWEETELKARRLVEAAGAASLVGSGT